MYPPVSRIPAFNGLKHRSHEPLIALHWPLSASRTSVIAMKPDTEKYLPFVEVFDLTEEEKKQLIRDVITVMQSALDAQLGMHPVQQNRGYFHNQSLRNPDEPLDLESSHVSDLFGEAANDDVIESRKERKNHG